MVRRRDRAEIPRFDYYYDYYAPYREMMDELVRKDRRQRRIALVIVVLLVLRRLSNSYLKAAAADAGCFPAMRPPGR